MSWLERILGGGREAGGRASTASVRRIAEELDRWPPERAHHVAAFACVLARVAQADLQVDDQERRSMETQLAEVGGLDAEEARAAVELAVAQGATDHYLATREFKERSDKGERARLVDCAFAVAAADGSISADESHVALAVAEELGFSRPEALGLRLRWREHLAELRPAGDDSD
ncbi:MAG: TerB family tellurite resistance protein [Myxococcota bacterium]